MSVRGVLCVGGYRTHQENHAAAFVADGRAKPVAVTSGVGASATRIELDRQFAGDLSVPYLDDAFTAVRDPACDLVSCCPDIEQRRETVLAIAGSGKPVYLDKPLAANHEDGIAIARALDDAGSVAQMYSFVNTPFARAARDCVVAGRLGTLLSVSVDVLFAKGPGNTAPDGPRRAETVRRDRFTFAEAKREFFDLGVYSVGLALWLGGARATRVSATTGNYFFSQHAELGVEDMGAATLTLANGVLASVAGGRIGWDSHPAGGPHRITLVGAEDTARFDVWEPRMEVHSGRIAGQLPEPHELDPMGMWRSTGLVAGLPRKRGYVPYHDETAWYPDDVRAFLDVLDGGGPPMMGPVLAADACAVVDAVFESASKRRAVVLDAP